ncbi:MAG: cob(I)yrinic acid a,c-diamide adenosyltransferase [Candidatus Kerfeldbacteria bacterium]|nr:cob(I)yrinic acid a,c-diamide adenosyltransferase [Candidatus Kerfeldbacteria bacterium]
MKRFDRSKFSRAGKRSGSGHGLTILYIGDGKGKTTAAMGLALRAHGAGLRVAVLQLMKSPTWQSYERTALAKLGIRVRVLGSGFVGILDDRHPVSWHRRSAKTALAKVRAAVGSGRYDVVIADEAVTAVEEGLLGVRDILGLIRAKPARVHLVLTGHTHYPSIIRACDLVTDMRMIKHPYKDQGLLAQRGIDF